MPVVVIDDGHRLMLTALFVKLWRLLSHLKYSNGFELPFELTFSITFVSLLLLKWCQRSTPSVGGFWVPIP